LTLHVLILGCSDMYAIYFKGIRFYARCNIYWSGMVGNGSCLKVGYNMDIWKGSIKKVEIMISIVIWYNKDGYSIRIIF
jgi:hypothetical protein